MRGDGSAGSDGGLYRDGDIEGGPYAGRQGLLFILIWGFKAFYLAMKP